MSDQTVLQSLHILRLGPVDPWALVTDSPPEPQIPEPALALLGSECGVHIGETQLHSQREELGVDISDLLADLQSGVLP